MHCYIRGYLLRFCNEVDREWDCYYDRPSKTYHRVIGIVIHRMFIGIRIYHPGW